jgi:hypothetical protein
LPKSGDQESSPDMNFNDEDFFSNPKPQSPLMTREKVSEIEDQLPQMMQLFDSSRSPNILSQTSKYNLCYLDISEEDNNAVKSVGESKKRSSVGHIRGLKT